jgi:succinate dehydrogenase / fumarate reductase, cytochrome b subunit
MIDSSLARSRPVSGLLSLWHTTVGKKFVMAICGLIWFGYLILHLWGNLKIYAGASYINAYGEFLRQVGDPFFQNSQLLWLARIILIPALILHIIAATQLKQRDLASRPRGYAKWRPLESTWASRTMLWGGIFILLFIIWHVLDLTLGAVNPGFVEGQIYHNEILSFSRPIVSLFYVLAVIAVGFHLWHGIWSSWQTLGLNSRRSSRLVRNLATLIAVVLTVLNISIPIAVFTGFIH